MSHAFFVVCSISLNQLSPPPRSFFKKENLSEIPSECLTSWIQDQVRQKVGPDLSLNCLQLLSADSIKARFVFESVCAVNGGAMHVQFWT